MPPFDFHQKYLQKLDENAHLRALSRHDGIIFSSNDYLALANSPDLKAAAQTAIDQNIAMGSGGSRLLSGNHEQHIKLEQEAAAFFGAPSALFFANGYAANMAVISTLPQKGDMIFYDALIHASSHDGMRLARCPSQPFAHNDSDDLEDKIKQWRMENANGCAWILFETLYSMDGDIAPINALATIAQKYDAMMVIDEAHATGILGPDGRGLTALLAPNLNIMNNSIILHTCGKAMGVEGALLCLPSIAKDFLINRGRHFIFSTAPSPFMAYLVRASLKLLKNQPDRRERLLHLCQYAADKFAPLMSLTDHSLSSENLSFASPIIPIIIGDAGRALAIAHMLQAKGFDVRAIRPPTVADGTSRLRICISLNIDESHIDNLYNALDNIMREQNEPSPHYNATS